MKIKFFLINIRATSIESEIQRLCSVTMIISTQVNYENAEE